MILNSTTVTLNYVSTLFAARIKVNESKSDASSWIYWLGLINRNRYIKNYDTIEEMVSVEK